MSNVVRFYGESEDYSGSMYQVEDTVMKSEAIIDKDGQ